MGTGGSPRPVLWIGPHRQNQHLLLTCDLPLCKAPPSPCALILPSVKREAPLTLRLRVPAIDRATAKGLCPPCLSWGHVWLGLLPGGGAQGSGGDVAACGAQAPLCLALAEPRTPAWLARPCAEPQREPRWNYRPLPWDRGARTVHQVWRQRRARSSDSPVWGLSRTGPLGLGLSFLGVLSCLPQPTTFFRAGSVFLACSRRSVNVGVRGGGQDALDGVFSWPLLPSFRTCSLWYRMAFSC